MVDIHEGCIFVGHACRSSTLLLGRSKPSLLLQTSLEIWDLRCDFCSHARYKKQNEWTSADLRGGRSYLGFGAEVATKAEGVFFKLSIHFARWVWHAMPLSFQTYDCSHQPCWKLFLFFCIFWNLCHFGGYNVNQKAPSRRTAIRVILPVEFLVADLLTFNTWSKPEHSMTKYSQWSSWIHWQVLPAEGCPSKIYLNCPTQTTTLRHVPVKAPHPRKYFELASRWLSFCFLWRNCKLTLLCALLETSLIWLHLITYLYVGRCELCSQYFTVLDCLFWTSILNLLQ